MLSEFDDLVKKREELKSWWSLKLKEVGWGDGNHILRVDVPRPSMIAFCGQAYAGAKNYHDAPTWFAECVQHEMQQESARMTQQAYEKKLASLNA
ncbi:MAG: hypothetical protein KDK71_10615, partial [Chlamydiia bacterium]|nr:hypothetical protein [Chlamydiia bacterium]